MKEKAESVFVVLRSLKVEGLSNILASKEKKGEGTVGQGSREG